MVLLREGCVVYHGPRAALRGYFASLGFAPPAESGAQAHHAASQSASAGAAAGHSSAGGHATGHAAQGPNADLADWLVSLLSSPQAVWEQQLKSQSQHKSSSVAVTPPVTTDALAAAWRRACGADGCLQPALAAEMMAAGALAAASGLALPIPDAATTPTPASASSSAAAAAAGSAATSGEGAAPAPVAVIDAAAVVSTAPAGGLSTPDSASTAAAQRKWAPSLALETPWAARQYGSGRGQGAILGNGYGRAFGSQVATLAARQAKLTRRDAPFMFARVGGSVIMALILGSLFWRTGIADFNLKIGACLFALIHVAFGSGIEVPGIIDQRYVIYKQLAARMYSPAAAVFSYLLALLPLTIAEILSFSAVLYFMAGFADSAGRYFYFAAILFAVALAESAFFRVVAYASPSLETVRSRCPCSFPRSVGTPCAVS